MSNPYRDPALRIELGQRALDALMTPDDWGELIRKAVEQELGGLTSGVDMNDTSRSTADRKVPFRFRLYCRLLGIILRPSKADSGDPR